MTRQQDDADVQVAALAVFMLGFAAVVSGAVVLLARRVRAMT